MPRERGPGAREPELPGARYYSARFAGGSQHVHRHLMPDALMEARPGCRLPFSQTGVNGQEVGGVAFDLRSRRPAAVKAQQYLYRHAPHMQELGVLRQPVLL